MPIIDDPPRPPHPMDVIRREAREKDAEQRAKAGNGQRGEKKFINGEPASDLKLVAAKTATIEDLTMVATKNKQSYPERMFLMAKNNLTDKRKHFGYGITGSPLYENPEIVASRIVWGDRLEGTARELLAQAEDDGDGDSGGGGSNRTTSAQEAIKFLVSALARGERKQSEIAAEAEAVDISAGRISAASQKLDIAKRKDGVAGPWMWKLR